MNFCRMFILRMMKTPILLFLLCLCNFSQAQITYSSSCEAHDTVIKYYFEDAQKLNISHIFRSNSPYKDSIALNRNITSAYLRALTAIYNATAMPARDSVISLFSIHIYNPGLHNVIFAADSNLPWMKNLHANLPSTGFNTIDSLMAKHYLKKTYFGAVGSTSLNACTFSSDTTYNTAALAAFLLRIQGVHNADMDLFFGEGNNIEDTVNPNFNWFRYTYGWGDCHNGCMFHKYWQFRVYNDCSVAYGGTYGYPLDVGIKTNQIAFDNLKVYPNPTSSTLYLDMLPEKATISLVNLLGDTIYSRNAPVTSLDLTDWSAGIYFLKIAEEDKQRFWKIIKE